MANPIFVTSENVKFNGTLDNAAVLDTTTDVRSLVLWDDLSLEDQGILTKFVNDNGGALPLVGPTAGQQLVDFLSTVKAGDATGLSNVSAATAAVATVDIGGDKAAGDASGLSSAQGTHGIQVANFDPFLLPGTSTGLVLTPGYQAATFGVNLTGPTASGLLADAAGYQVVDVGGAKVGANPTGLAIGTAGTQVVNVGGAKVGGDPTGLTNDATVYTASIDIDGGAHVRAVTVTGSAAQDFTTLLAELNADSGAWYTASLSGGNILITSNQTGAYSAIAITDGTLFAALTGYVAIVAATPGTGTTYTASIDVDGNPIAISLDGGTAQTFTELLAAINIDLGVAGTASLAGGNVVITSATTGLASTVAITDTDLFLTLTGYVAVLAAVGGTHPVYTTTITVDGVAKPISIDGSAAQTIATVISEINTDLGASAVAAIDVNGDIRVTSALQGSLSSVSMIAGTLFPALSNYTAIASAVAGTGSAAALTATVVVDGVTKNISILPIAIPTFADVIVELNADLGASAVASVSGGDIKITSATYGLYSTVVITAGTLFPALTGFSYLLPAQNGGGSSRTYSATAVVDGTHVRPVNFTGLAGDTLQHVLDEINADLNVAAAAGYQDVKFGVNRAATYTTGLVNDATAYTATVVLDGGSRAVSVVGSAAQTYTDLLTQIQTDLDNGGVIAVASLVNGKLRIASTTVSSASTVAITDTGTHPLFASLSFFLEVAPAVVGNDLVTYATASISGGNIIVTSNTTGVKSAVDLYDNGFLFNRLTGYVGISTIPGVAPTIYTAVVKADGVDRAIAVQGSAAQTFTNLLTEINTDLHAGTNVATAVLTTPVAGYQNVLFSAVKTGASATGLANDATAYTASILVDGVAKPISVVGSAAQTFTNLLAEIDTDLGASAAATINADGGLVITSATTGITSLVVITDGVALPLFGTLTDYVSLDANQHGIGSDIKVTSATTGIASTVAITDGTLFRAVGAKGIKPSIAGIANMLSAAKLQKTSVGMPVADHFNVITVGLTPSSLWSIDHVPVKANIPKVPQFTYYGTDGKWKWLADDTNVNP
ncbi:hypothetical protein M0R04_07055 [Candidatus Dojkabacteria bacterium]|jgi:hypothetical protein|nr:hypothetical protein [Candidatus Dojkabacteria bacterium]